MALEVSLNEVTQDLRDENLLVLLLKTEIPITNSLPDEWLMEFWHVQKAQIEGVWGMIGLFQDVHPP